MALEEGEKAKASEEEEKAQASEEGENAQAEERLARAGPLKKQSSFRWCSAASNASTARSATSFSSTTANVLSTIVCWGRSNKFSPFFYLSSPSSLIEKSTDFPRFDLHADSGALNK